MQAIVAACDEGKINAIPVVIGSRTDAPAIFVAESLGVETAIVPFGPDYPTRLLEAIKHYQPVLICLAGYMKLFPSEVLERYPNRVLNIHPALLPKYGGQGMYGHHVHEAVVAHRETESGCTVHYVNAEYDDGQIILQKRVPVFRHDTPSDVASRVLEQEHLAYPEAIQVVLDRTRVEPSGPEREAIAFPSSVPNLDRE